MRTLILGFAAGAAWLADAGQPAAACGHGAAGVIAGAALRLRCRCVATRAGAAAIALAAGVGLGFYWAAWLAQAAMAPQLALADEGQDIIVTGTIASLPYRFEQGVRFNFAVEKAAGARVPPLIALSWYAGFRDAGDERRGRCAAGRALAFDGAAAASARQRESAWVLITKRGCWSRACAPPAMCGRSRAPIRPTCAWPPSCPASAMWWRPAARPCARASCAAWTASSMRA